MKKWIIVLCLFSFMFIGVYKVGAIQHTPVGRNYLSMSNLSVHYDNPYFASTIESIVIESQKPYTLVLSYEFIGQHTQGIDYLSVTILQSISQEEHDYELQDDSVNQRVYIEFESATQEVEIINIPIAIDVNVYQVILYQGYYADFIGFEPYLNHEDKINYEGVLMIDVDNPWDTSTILSLFTAKDPLGNLLDIIIEEDDYSQSNKLPGSYRFQMSTTHNQIKKFYTINIEVYDITAPVMSIEDTLVIPLTEKISIEDIIEQVSIIDNVDSLNHSEIQVIEDTYSSAIHVGYYHLKLAISDSSNNEGFLTVNIQLVDRQAPSAQYPQNIFIYNTDDPLTNDDILSKFIIIDDVDGTHVTTEWIVNEYNQTQIAGIYQMTLSTKDTQLNESLHTIYIHVIDHRGPIFEANELILTVESHRMMSDDDIIDWFYQQASIEGLDISHVRILYNEYELANKQSGEHFIYLSYIHQGEEVTSRILMQVSDRDVTSSTIYYGIALAILLSGVGMYLIKKKKI